jgi:hypothetical protein
MSKLTFTVEVWSDDPQTDVFYLEKLRDTFAHVCNLAAWSYTEDDRELSANIELGSINND